MTTSWIFGPAFVSKSFDVKPQRGPERLCFRPNPQNRGGFCSFFEQIHPLFFYGGYHRITLSSLFKVLIGFTPQNRKNVLIGQDNHPAHVGEATSLPLRCDFWAAGWMANMLEICTNSPDHIPFWKAVLRGRLIASPTMAGHKPSCSIPICLLLSQDKHII